MIKLGSTDITNVMLGTTKVDAIFLGNTKVYPNLPVVEGIAVKRKPNVALPVIKLG